MATQPQAGPSTGGTAARAPPPASVEGHFYRATEQKCVVLVDWWLVRGKGDKICVAGYTERNRAARLFCSSPITMRHADGTTLETADQRILRIRGPLNIAKMHSNGFPYEVSKYFRLGFPAQWERYANSNMEQMNENTKSPSKSTEYYIEKLLRGSFCNSEEYSFLEVDLKSSKGPTATDGPPSRGHPDLSNGAPRIQEPSGNSGNYHNSVSNKTASEGLCNGRMGMPDESSEGSGPGETCSGQTSQAEKPHELKALAKGLSLAFRPSQCSKDNTGRKLRSGKVCGLSNGDSFNKGNSKRKTMQHETLNMKVVPIEETEPPSEPTCHENGGSAAQIPAADELRSQDSSLKGRGRERPRTRASTRS